MAKNIDWMTPAQRDEWAKMWNDMTELNNERRPIAKKLAARKTGGGPTPEEYKRLLDLNRQIVELDKKQRKLLDQHPMKKLVRKLTNSE